MRDDQSVRAADAYAVSSGAAIVIPTYLREWASRSATTAAVIGPIIGRVVLACNSAEAAEAARCSGLDFTEHGRNEGYGGAVNRAAARCDRSTRGLLILNDDIEVSGAAGDLMRRRIDEAAGSDVMLFHGDEVASPFGTPGPLGVLMRVSGLWALRRHLPHRLRGRSAPFYAAFVGWAIWDELGGFDVDRYPLYFEDSDFLERALARGARVSRHHAQIKAATSGTSRQFAGTVGALSAGAENFLAHHHSWPRWVAAGAVRLALLIRVPVMFAGRRPASARAALRAVFSSRVVWRHSLPPYQ